jgi:hypothetical protein
VDSGAPTTAPSGFKVTDPLLVDFNSQFVALEWTRPTGAGVISTDPDAPMDSLRYEIYATDDVNPHIDFLLVAIHPDSGQTAALQQFPNWDVCAGPLGPIFCTGENDSNPFSNENVATLRVRACTNDGCGPFSLPLTVEDKSPPLFVPPSVGADSITFGGRTYNVGNVAATTFTLSVTIDERSNAGTVGVTFGKTVGDTFAFPGNATTGPACVPQPDAVSPAPSVRENGWDKPDFVTVHMDCTCPAQADCTRTINPAGGATVGFPINVRLTVSDENGNSATSEAGVNVPVIGVP